jgi:hypothetical protein
MKRVDRETDTDCLPIKLTSSMMMMMMMMMDDRGVRVPIGARNFYPHRRVQTGSVAHPTSYPMGTRGSFPGGKAAGA